MHVGEREREEKLENPELPHNVQYVLYKKRKDPYVKAENRK
jgi:hypothetical protein